MPRNPKAIALDRGTRAVASLRKGTEMQALLLLRRNQAIRHCYEVEIPIAEICRHFNLSRPYVYSVLRETDEVA